MHAFVLPEANGRRGQVTHVTITSEAGFDDDARDAAERKVTMKLDREPLRAGLERVCRELGLAMKVDAKRNVVRFSRVK